MRWTGETSSRLKLGVQIHVSETRQDVLNLQKLTDKCVFEYLDQFGLLSDRFSAVHCVHISEKDVELAKKRGISVIYKPKSNMKLGSGIAPISSLLKSGVNVALATDGPASNDTLDLPEEMRAGAMLQKVASEDPSALSARDVFRMATAGGAAAMGVNSGVLDEGKLADLAILDMSAGNLLCFGDDIIPLIVYCLRSENVESVIVNGKFLMRNHKILTADEDTILSELRTSAKRYLL